MANKTTKRKQRPTAPATPQQATSDRLAAAKRELRQLRELRALLKTIERQRNAVEADALNAARNLCAGTGYGVYDMQAVRSAQVWEAETIRRRDEGEADTTTNAAAARAGRGL